MTEPETNWSGHVLDSPHIGRWYKWLKAPTDWGYRVGKVQSVRVEDGRTWLHFEEAITWVPLDECEVWQ